MIAVIATALAVHFNILACDFKSASLQTALLLALILLCLSFAVGLFATNRYHASGLQLVRFPLALPAPLCRVHSFQFAKLLLIHLIVLHLSCIFFFVIPTGREKYRMDGVLATAVFALSYLMAFCAAAIPLVSNSFSPRSRSSTTFVRRRSPFDSVTNWLNYSPTMDTSRASRATNGHTELLDVHV